MPKEKYYVVWIGKNSGIYHTWDDCKEQIEGITNAKYKSFETIEAANIAFQGSPNDYINISKVKWKNATNPIIFPSTPVMPSLCVDAACAGNPGFMEYRGVYTHNKEEIFHQGPFAVGTNNIGEFLAIVHALAWLDKNNINIPVYTDSLTALSWIRQKKCNTKLEMNIDNQKLFELKFRAEDWLRSHTWNIEILKWDTEKWGEIPADFGRK